MLRRSSEAERACGLKSHVEADLAVVLAGIFEARDLKRPLDRSQLRNDHLPVPHRAIEEILAHSLIGARILEDAVAGDARGLDAGAVEKLAPAPDRLRVGRVDGRRVEGERARP